MRYSYHALLWLVFSRVLYMLRVTEKDTGRTCVEHGMVWATWRALQGALEGNGRDKSLIATRVGALHPVCARQHAANISIPSWNMVAIICLEMTTTTAHPHHPSL